MKNNSTILVIILICIIIALFGLFIVKIFNIEINSKPQSNYTKEEVIALVKDTNNKNNYEVECTNEYSYFYKIKYCNMREKVVAYNDDRKMITYYDYNKNTQTAVSEEKKMAIIMEESAEPANYMPLGVLPAIENPKSRIVYEEMILDRNAIVLEYEDTVKSDGFYFKPSNFNPQNDDKKEYEYIMKIWIDEETGLLLKLLVEVDNEKIILTYNLKTNSVTEEDVELPDLSGYKIIDDRNQ